jgi:hypothetical protein
MSTPPAGHAPRRSFVERERRGLVSGVDGRGDRLIWLTCPAPSRATVLVAAHVNEPAGLTDLSVAEVSRRRLRDGREQLRRSTGLRLVECPFEVADALVMEAWQRSRPEDRHLDYPTVRRRLTQEQSTAPAEPVSRHLEPVDADTAPALVHESASLLEQPEFASWWPSGEGAAAAVREIDALDASPLVLSEAAQERRLAQALRDATVRLYPPAVLARRLEATAYVLAETTRVDAARIALAVATVVRAHPDGIADVPLFATLVNQGLGRHLASYRSSQADTRRDALVVTPDEIRARSSSRPRHTRD